MSETAQMGDHLTSELERLKIPCRPIVMPTPWSVGPVAAYLFADEPVTLIDSGLASGRPIVEEVLRAAGHRARDVSRVIVTHSHGDHFGGALWLQDESGCDVLLHRSEVEMLTDPRRRELVRALFAPLQFDEAKLKEYESRPDTRLPALTPVSDGDEFQVAERTLRVEHHAGHTPGHLWVTDMTSNAMFTGDYLLASGPTNPGMMLDTENPSGRAPLLAEYVAGLRLLADRKAPALFAGHGPAITDSAALVARRLAKIERRTRRVLEELATLDDPTAAEVADRMYRGRARGSWDVMAELVGHLDLLVAEGRAAARLGEDGYWHFRSLIPQGGPDA